MRPPLFFPYSCFVHILQVQTKFPFRKFLMNKC